jgi:6-pyruvoyltetrahydropterin/6-carboxytetrahydropterin synthase
MGKFYSTKTFGNDRGLSTCFRQWRATHSHCSTLHGYSIGIKLVFACDTLDEKNWAMDFGGLKTFKAWAEHMFDHTWVIAKDDPLLETCKMFNSLTKIADIREVDAVGCEMFAKLAYDEMSRILEEMKRTGSYPINSTVRVKYVEVFEHGANSAIYEG